MDLNLDFKLGGLPGAADHRDVHILGINTRACVCVRVSVAVWSVLATSGRHWGLL